MSKISVKKLIKKIESDKKNYRDINGYYIFGDDKYGHGYMNAADTIISIIKDMQTKAERKKADKIVGADDTDSLKEISPMLMQYGLFLSQTSTILSSGKGKKIYSVGDVIPIMYFGKPVDFDIVEVADHGIKLISHDILAFQPFDINGNNVYDKSNIKDYLENEFEKCFDAEFIKLLGNNKFYIPSVSELRSSYHKCEQRIKKYKNVPCEYWTKTPTTAATYFETYITKKGYINNGDVNYIGGVAPAVIIGSLD